MCALDQEHAKLISASEDELEVEALSRVTVDTHWKINLFRWVPSKISKIKRNRKSIICSAKPNSLPATIKLIDECKSEDLGSIFTRWTLSLPHQNIFCNILAGLGNSGSWKQLHRCHSWRSFSYFANSGKQVWSATILVDQGLPGWGNHIGNYPFQMILILWPLHHSQHFHDGSWLGVASWLPCKL